DKPADKVKPVDKVKPAGVDKVKPAGSDKVKPAGSDKVKPAGQPKPPTDDDLLGKLQGGSKSGNKHPPELKKPPDKAIDDPSLKQPPKSPADPRGYAAITSSPSSKIWVDGKDTGLSTPITGHALPLSPGKHKI